MLPYHKRRQKKLKGLLKGTELTPIPQTEITLLKRGVGLIIWGLSGCGKTALTMELIRIAMDDPENAPIPIDKHDCLLYIDGEADGMLQNRLLTVFGQRANVFAIETQKREAIFIHETDKWVNLVAEFVATVGMKPSIVVIDTLQAHQQHDDHVYTKGSEISRTIKQVASKFACACVVLHHTTKAGNTFLGSQKLRDNNQMVRLEPTERGGKVISDKIKDMKPFQFGYRLIQGDYSVKAEIGIVTESEPIDYRVHVLANQWLLETGVKSASDVSMIALAKFAYRNDNMTSVTPKRKAELSSIIESFLEDNDPIDDYDDDFSNGV